MTKLTKCLKKVLIFFYFFKNTFRISISYLKSQNVCLFVCLWVKKNHFVQITYNCTGVHQIKLNYDFTVVQHALDNLKIKMT